MKNEIVVEIRKLEICNYSPKTVKKDTNDLKKYFAFKKADLNQLYNDNIKDFYSSAKIKISQLK